MSGTLPADAAGALEAFLIALRTRSASPGTIVEYRRHAAEFIAFVTRRGADWRAPDRATIRAFLADLADRGLSPSSVAGHVAAARSLYRWEGKACEDPEVRLTIKTLTSCESALQAFFAEAHPYELPQFLAVRMQASPAYFDWVRTAVTS